MSMRHHDLQMLMLKFNQIVIKAMDQIPNLIEEIFTPRLLIKQVLLATALHGAMMGVDGVYKLIANIWMHYVSGVGKKMYRIEKKMAAATNYKDWLVLARQHDELSGKMKWRKEDSSPLIDAKGLRRRIREVKYFVNKDDPIALKFRLSGCITRNQFGVQHEELHSYAMSGTKRVIIEYNDTIQSALEYLCDCDESRLTLEEKFSFFSELRHAYGRTALLLSGGAYLGYYHMGIFKSLWINGMLPKVISGASAGSLMAAIVGTKTDKQLDEVFRDLKDDVDGYRRDYFKFSDKIKSPLGNIVQSIIPQSLRWISNPLIQLFFDGTLLNLDVEHLSEVVIDNVGHYTFQEAFDRTGRIINITVAPLNDYDPPRLLNYLTAPHVCVWSAAVASCAIPSVFDPVQLVVKAPKGVDVSLPRSIMESSEDNGRVKGYSDGSIENDLPMEQLSEMFNANHFIVSQVNPHSAMFSVLSLRKGSPLYKSSFLFRMVTGFVHFLKEECRSYAVNLLSFFSTSFFRAPLWSAKRGLYSVITQKYEGSEDDITISPWSRHLSVPAAWLSIIKNPTDTEYKEVVHQSEEAVFSYMPRIKARCRIEMTLEYCTQKLKRRINQQATKALHANANTNGEGIDPTDAYVESTETEGKSPPIRRAPSFATSRMMDSM